MANSLPSRLPQTRQSPVVTSILSIGFSILAFGTLSYAGLRREDGEALSRALLDQDQAWRWFVILGAFFIVLRLVSGSIGRVKSGEPQEATLGEIYSDVADRIADVFIIMGCALIAKGPYRLDLGWFCGVAAVGAAYVKTLSQVVGVKHGSFGFLAKNYRMIVLLGGCVVLAIFSGVVRGHNLMDAALFVAAVGALYESWRSIRAITHEFRSRSELNR